MIARIGWFIAVLVLSESEGRHYDADKMLPNERTSLDDCSIRFHQLVRSTVAAPASGATALIKEFAHMGAIGWTQPDGKVLWHCGGTLIWVDYVLTAAHCVVDHRDVRPDLVRFGDLNLESDDDNEYAQKLKIIEIHRHPLHRFRAKYHDIALLKLEKPVRLHDTVCPACLWINEEIRFTEFVATGWGSTGYWMRFLVNLQMWTFTLTSTKANVDTDMDEDADVVLSGKIRMVLFVFPPEHPHDMFTAQCGCGGGCQDSCRCSAIPDTTVHLR